MGSRAARKQLLPRPQRHVTRLAKLGTLGKAKRRLRLEELTMAEYLYGMLKAVKAAPNNLRHTFSSHLQEVMKHAMTYSWAAILAFETEL